MFSEQDVNRHAAGKAEPLAPDLAAGLIHELSQPLTSIGTTARAVARLLEAGPVDSAELLEALRRIAAQADRAGEIIRRMRDLLLHGTSHRTPTDLHEVVRESVQQLRDDFIRARVRPRLALADDAPTVLIDPVQIGQVLVNLLRNACEAMADVPVARRLLNVRSHCEGGEVVVTVSDRGQGLSAGIIGRLFEPFASSKPQGMGIGLALSRHIVQAHGGRIWGTPNPDGGMTFGIALPLPTNNVPTPPLSHGNPS